jgi:hypothetical protein
MDSCDVERLNELLEQDVELREVRVNIHNDMGSRWLPLTSKTSPF